MGKSLIIFTQFYVLNCKNDIVMINLKIPFFCYLFLFITTMLQMHAQSGPPPGETPHPFWSKVRYGGGIGLNVGNNFTNITLAPSAIYEFNQYVALGVGLQGSYVKVRSLYDSFIYGGSLISLFTPIPELQLSAELEQVRVNLDFFDDVKDNFWNTGLFLGAGFRQGNFTAGLRYNVLHNNNRNIYAEAWMPFVRVFF
jgi:hypothetical protein